MAAPKKAAVNTPMSKILKANPNFAKEVKTNMPKQKAKPTTPTAAKANLLKQKGRMDEAKAYRKIGKELSAPGVKYGSSYDSASKTVKLNDERGMSATRKGIYVARKAAQPYGEAVRTNARVQAQAKKAQAKKTK